MILKLLKTQINNIVLKKVAIFAQWQQGASGSRKIVAPRRCLYPDVNDAVFEWFCQARAKTISITGRLIQEKAARVALESNHDAFSASNGWLSRFQIRHNIKCSVLNGEASDVSEEVVAVWSGHLKDMCEGYAANDIFSYDETSLFYRTLPTQSLVVKSDSCKGGKHAKDKITVLLCASVSGEKLQPLVIGKSRNPRSFRGYHRTLLLVQYESNTKAWMSGVIFKSWMKKLNQKKRVQNRNILLFMDNCGAHPKITFSYIKLMLG